MGALLLRGSVWGISSAIQYILVKVAYSKYSVEVPILLFIRSLVLLVCSYVGGKIQNVDFSNISQTQIIDLVKKSLCAFGMMICSYVCIWSIQYLSVAIALMALDAFLMPIVEIYHRGKEFNWVSKLLHLNGLIGVILIISFYVDMPMNFRSTHIYTQKNPSSHSEVQSD